MRKSFIVPVIAAVLSTGLLIAAVSPSSVFGAEPGHKHGEGEMHKLGRKTIGGYTVSVILIGEVEPGGHVDFDIKLIDAKSDPKALRVWVGTADGKGSQKADGKKGATTYAGEVNVPKPLAENAKLWVEVETDAGIKSASYEIEKHDHKH